MRILIQDRYIKGVRGGHTAIRDAVGGVVLLGVTQNRAMWSSATGHELEIMSAVKRVEAMHHRVNKMNAFAHSVIIEK